MRMDGCQSQYVSYLEFFSAIRTAIGTDCFVQYKSKFLERFHAA